MTNEGICKSCPYFHAPGGGERGACRRFPPVPLVGAGHVQPMVSDNHWCGEHPDRRGAPSLPMPANGDVAPAPSLDAVGKALMAVEPPKARKRKAA